MRALLTDTRQQAGKHSHKDAWFDEHGIATLRTKVPVGDYCEAPSVSVDTKKDIYELAMDIDRDHERFKREMITARDLGCRLVVLVENTDGIKSLEDLAEWREPMGHLAMRKRSSKSVTARQIHGSRLAKACKTMEARYGVSFMFCHPEESAELICRILGGGADA